MKQLLSILLLGLAFLSFADKQLIPQPSGTLEFKTDSAVKFIGPEKGYLVIAGAYHDKPILDKFVDLLGNKNSKIVIITTAGEDSRQNEKYYKEVKKCFNDCGAKNIEILHTRDTAVANSAPFLKAIREAKGVWFTGGRQWRLVDAYFDTKVLKELNDLLDRGGVIGGNSAGATIQGSFLVRGDTKTPLIMDGDHKKGFNFVKHTAIDQHLLVRNRQFDMFEIRAKYPELLGIGIDEKTAIVVHKNEFEVIGEKYVAIFDGTMLSQDNDTIIKLPPDSKQFYFLSSGDKYDLQKRQVSKLGKR